MDQFDVVVVGVGCMGAAACAVLAERGVRVLGLERSTIPNALGSSGHQSRAFRLVYFEHPDYVPLLKRAHALWLELNDFVDEHGPALELDPGMVFHETGGLYLGPAGGDFIEQAQAAAEAHDLDCERLTAEDIGKQFPQFELPGSFVGLLEPRAGLIVPERAIAAQAARARVASASLLEDTAMLSWRSTHQGLIVETTRGEFATDRLILTAGSWMPPLCPNLPLRVTRQILGWVQPPHPDALRYPALGVWAIELPDTSLLYGFPLIDGLPGAQGFKLARHWPSETCEADTVDRVTTAADAEDFLKPMRSLLPSAVGPVVDLQTCLYTNTPDGHFIIDTHADDDRVVIATGFSGHGFKFQPVIGEILADLATTGTTPHPIEFLSADRLDRSLGNSGASEIE
jgi:sarcosine oxidase